MKHLTLNNLLSSAKKILDSKEAKLEVQLLLEHVLNINHAWLITHGNDEVSPEDYNQFQALLARRLNGEPIAYILGEREFYGLPFRTTPDTLIPRSDTETLVDVALKKISPSNHVLDLGTGTGVIAITIAKQRPTSTVTAIDFSEGALTVAQENAKTLGTDNVRFLQSSWFDALENQRFDVIVSNPPYIEDNDPHLSQGDLRFEPRTALASGADGLDAIRHIIQKAPAHLNASGWLMFEHGYNQAEQVGQLFKSAEFAAVETIKDLGGNDRVTLGQLI